MTSPEPFEGKIGRSFQDSEPWWPPLPATADGQSPNVVIILFDDTGFAPFGCYGSTIETPNIDALAPSGSSQERCYRREAGTAPSMPPCGLR